MFTLQDRIAQITIHTELLKQLRLELTKCAYQRDLFSPILSQMQSVIDELNNLRCFNMSVFIDRLNAEIASLLETRANNALATWLVAFRRRQREESANLIQEEEAISEERETVAEPSVYDAVMQVNCVHLIRVVSHNLTVTPPVADTKKQWLDSLLVAL